MSRQWMDDLNDVRVRLLAALPELAEMPPTDRDALLEEARQRAQRKTWLEAYGSLAALGASVLGLGLGFQTLIDWPRLPYLVQVLVVAGSVVGVRYGIYRLVMRPLKCRVVGRELWALMPMRCGACGYDLTGNTSGTCPECGRDVSGPGGG